MLRFPSLEWFDAVRAAYNGDDRYHGGGAGACNAEIGVRVGDALFALTFSGHDCTRAAVIGEPDLSRLDFYLEMPLAHWQAMLRNIREHGHAVAEHTLNTLDLDLDEGITRSATGDQYRTDLFFRFNQTFQNFFDASAAVETRFE
jgi:hypothetical protein